MIVTLEQVADRLAVADVLARYSRGVDRCDIESLRNVWWPDAVADYWGAPQNAMEWCTIIVAAVAGYLRTQHFIGNMIIDLQGDTASAETYVQAYHESAGPDGPIEMVVGGRYLDRLEKRDGEWRIALRRYVMDWNRNGPSTSQWDQGLYAMLQRRGGRLPDDPLYTGA